MFKNPFSFEGRIRRLEYGLSHLIGSLILSIVVAVSNGGSNDDTARIFLVFLNIPYLWFILAQGAKRCHDIGNNGWWQLIPFYGLWMLFQDGHPGPNQYGKNPKGIQSIAYQNVLDHEILGDYHDDYDPSTVSNRDLAIRYGAIWGGSSIVMSLIAFLTGNDLTMPDTGAIKWVFMLVGLGITIWALVTAIKTDRERLGGFISFGRCISLSAFMGLISGLISMVYMFLYGYVINPNFQEQMKEAMYTQWEAQGMDEAQMEAAAGMAGMFTGPVFMGISQLIGGVIMGVIFGLIVGAFMKRERSIV